MCYTPLCRGPTPSTRDGQTHKTTPNAGGSLGRAPIKEALTSPLMSPTTEALEITWHNVMLKNHGVDAGNSKASKDGSLWDLGTMFSFKGLLQAFPCLKLCTRRSSTNSGPTKIPSPSHKNATSMEFWPGTFWT